ncbi:M-phase phosphoprotein 9 [Stigmatopora nigra]
MSTDDSISEDVSSSGPRSHSHSHAGGGKSEASQLSSEATTASGLGVSQTTGGTVKVTPACTKIRDLCLSTEEDAFSPGKNLPFINPSSLETLRALVEEIRSGGETDPQVWKDCEGRWLHLFQLVEKQYQEQILAQQGQYQCQIQLIQDEIKALVQLQNRSPQGDFTHSGAIQSIDRGTTKDLLLPLMSGDCPFPAHALSDSPATISPLALGNPPADERAATGLSSGYGTISAQETEDIRDPEEPSSAYRQKTSGQVLTSWAKRQKMRGKKIKAVVCEIPEYQELPRSAGETPDFHIPGVASSTLRRSDSLLSEASGLTYWRLNECDLYHRLPDTLDRSSGGPYYLQEPPVDQAEDLGVSLRDIYEHKINLKHSDWERSEVSTPVWLQPPPVDASRLSSTTPLSLDGISDASHEVLSTPRLKVGAEEEEATYNPSTSLRPGSASLDDPVVLSLLRQNLREKHSRHVADLKAYYKSEIKVLRDKLKLQDLPSDLEKSNRILSDRCQHLEKALTEAGQRIDSLEETNASLEKKLAEWPERYAVAGAAVKSLRQRLEDSKRSTREKAAAAAQARRRADDSEAKREREVRAKKEMLVQYDGVVKDNDRLKSTLLSTEDKLYQANDAISDLKRTISKLESQVRQLEHENQARVRHTPRSDPRPSGAGLFHHPDLLHSPGTANAEPDVTRRRSPRPEAHLPEPACKVYTSSFVFYRGVSPRVPDRTPPPSSFQDEGANLLTPIMRALIEMEETRATESRAPWLPNHKPQMCGVKSPLKSQRSLSPDGHRSSSLPPASLRSPIATTPSKREMLLSPMPAKGSPKRCPTENYSTAFGHMMPREEHLGDRSSPHADHTRRHSLHNGSPRKKLDFNLSDHRGNKAKDYKPTKILIFSPLFHADFSDKDQSLEDAERLFDELTREKNEIEATLSRMPPSSSGARVSRKSRLGQVALEERLELVNQELGSIRMTLKRFHVLRSSASIA